MLHLSLNLAAALLIYFAFFVKIKLTELLLCSFVFSALISVTLLSAYSNIDWYNGLSGLLHGLLVYFSIRLVREGDKILWLGLVLVWIKVVVEMIQASMGYSTLIGDMRVISEAHLIGASIGTLAVVICLVIPATVYRQFRKYLSLSWSRTPL
jgi:rhomboid family GlyGly-CTERM serine protease